jgi:CheY-like chemotaxis protein
MRSKRFEIIITDYLMPEMNGGEVTRLARRFSPDSFIIGCSIDAKARQFVDAGADAFLSKDQIMHQLTPLIEQRTLRQETKYDHAFPTESREIPPTYAASGTGKEAEEEEAPSKAVG